jgi:hypothetical protein
MTTAAASTHRWGRWEGQFESAGDHADAPESVELQVEMTSPSGVRRVLRAFWDGGRIWRVRCCPDETGTWTYVTRCAGVADDGLHNQAGSFTCVPYDGTNPLYRHGAIGLAQSRRHLAHADGTPFFYLADTAWNGPLMSTADEWELYLGDRAAKRFTTVQYATTQWRTATGDAAGHPAYTGTEHIRIDPAFFQRFDARVDAINAHGQLAAPLMLHAGRDTPLNPGLSLPEDQAIALARYMVARYGAHHVVWNLVAEADFQGENTEKWRRIGRAVYGAEPHAPVMIHPHSMRLMLDEFGDEGWLDIVGYQSGHYDDERALRWITTGPPSTDGRREPTRPVINLEPPYEGYLAYRSHGEREKVAEAVMRRAVYWSLLVSPPAGVTYGAHGVWGWDDGSGPPMGHPDVGTPLPWREALGLPGSTSMQHLAELMAALPWWRLRPAPELLARQPGDEDVRAYVVATRTEDGSLALVYTPREGSITLRLGDLAQPVRGTWFDPRTGARQAIGTVTPGSDGDVVVDTPGAGDWVLLLEHDAARAGGA